MFTNSVPTPSITVPHTRPSSYTNTETTFYTQRTSVPLFIYSACKIFLIPSLCFYHIPSFVNLFSKVSLSDFCFPSFSLTFTTSSKNVLLSLLLQVEPCTPASWQEGEKGGKNGMDEENSSGSHCCLHGEAADLAVCPLPPPPHRHTHTPNFYPLQPGFDMLKFRKHGRENGVI